MDLESPPGARLRLYRAGDRERVLELLQLGFKTWPREPVPVSAAEHLDWKLSSGPGADRTQVVVERDGRVVGLLFRMLAPARLGEARCLATSGYEAAVDPDQRGRGIYEAMRVHRVVFADQDFAVHFAPAELQPVVKAGNKLGERPLGNGPQLLVCPLVLRPRVAAAIGSRFGGRLAAIRARGALSGVRGPLRGNHLPAVSTLAAFDSRVDDLWDAAAPQFTFAFDRTAALLNWRFCDPRGGTYVVRAVERNGRLDGYAALRVSNGRGWIVDLLARPGEPDVVRALVIDALDEFRRQRLDTARCWLPAVHPYNDVLRAGGFLAMGRVAIRFHPLGPTGARLDLLARADLPIHFTAADSDRI